MRPLNCIMLSHKTRSTFGYVLTLNPFIDKENETDNFSGVYFHLYFIFFLAFQGFFMPFEIFFFYQNSSDHALC